MFFFLFQFNIDITFTVFLFFQDFFFSFILTEIYYIDVYSYNMM